eukprot:1180853-Prorocentrum_minimum.AAC.1
MSDALVVTLAGGAGWEYKAEVRSGGRPARLAQQNGAPWGCYQSQPIKLWSLCGANRMPGHRLAPHFIRAKAKQKLVRYPSSVGCSQVA